MHHKGHDTLTLSENIMPFIIVSLFKSVTVYLSAITSLLFQLQQLLPFS